MICKDGLQAMLILNAIVILWRGIVQGIEMHAMTLLFICLCIYLLNGLLWHRSSDVLDATLITTLW